MQTQQIGPLEVRIVGGSDTPQQSTAPVVMLLHGFGAPGDDLVALGRVLPVPPGTRFVFPQAPLVLDGWGDSRAWWMIDPESLERRQRGEVVDRRDELPPELADVRQKLSECIDAVLDQLGASDDDLVLGGFSQGSMLALDVALHRPRPPRALVLLSSTLIAQSVWRPRMPHCAGVPVFQSHGSQDPLLTFEAATELRDALASAGVEVDFTRFEGGHEIPPGVLRRLVAFLDRQLA